MVFRIFAFAMIPVLLVSFGIMVITQRMGVSPVYPELVVVGVFLGGAIFWFRGRSRKNNTAAR